MFCRIYTTINDIYEVLGFLSNKLGLPVTDKNYIENDTYFSMYIDANEEYSIHDEKNFPDGFLYFKTIIEIDFQDAVSLEYAINITDIILTELWGKGYPAIASCGYEEKLICNGGYNNKDVPWVDH